MTTPAEPDSAVFAVSNPRFRAASSRTSSCGKPHDEHVTAERSGDLRREKPDRAGAGHDDSIAGVTFGGSNRQLHTHASGSERAAA